MQPLAGIDAALSRAIEAKEVPGVVALAATEAGVLYDARLDCATLSTAPQ